MPPLPSLKGFPPGRRYGCPTETRFPDFLTGRSGKWKGCSLEWLLKPDTIAKVLGGFYEDRGLPAEPLPPKRKTSYDITELEKIDTLDGW